MEQDKDLDFPIKKTSLTKSNVKKAITSFLDGAFDDIKTGDFGDKKTIVVFVEKNKKNNMNMNED